MQVNWRYLLAVLGVLLLAVLSALVPSLVDVITGTSDDSVGEAIGGTLSAGAGAWALWLWRRLTDDDDDDGKPNIVDPDARVTTRPPLRAGASGAYLSVIALALVTGCAGASASMQVEQDETVSTSAAYGGFTLTTECVDGRRVVCLGYGLEFCLPLGKKTC